MDLVDVLVNIFLTLISPQVQIGLKAMWWEVWLRVEDEAPDAYANGG